jgi:hypothetical protein
MEQLEPSPTAKLYHEFAVFAGIPYQRRPDSRPCRIRYTSRNKVRAFKKKNFCRRISGKFSREAWFEGVRRLVDRHLFERSQIKFFAVLIEPGKCRGYRFDQFD